MRGRVSRPSRSASQTSVDEPARHEMNASFEPSGENLGEVFRQPAPWRERDGRSGGNGRLRVHGERPEVADDRERRVGDSARARGHRDLADARGARGRHALRRAPGRAAGDRRAGCARGLRSASSGRCPRSRGRRSARRRDRSTCAAASRAIRLRLVGRQDPAQGAVRRGHAPDLAAHGPRCEDDRRAVGREDGRPVPADRHARPRERDRVAARGRDGPERRRRSRGRRRGGELEHGGGLERDRLRVGRPRGARAERRQAARRAAECGDDPDARDRARCVGDLAAVRATMRAESCRVRRT